MCFYPASAADWRGLIRVRSARCFGQPGMARDRTPLPHLPDDRAPKAPAALSLGPLSDVLGNPIAQAAVTTFSLVERHVGQPFGLRKVEYLPLTLVLANGPLSPKNLVQARLQSAPNLTLLLDRLQALGLLRRERSQRDRRAQNVVLTAEGHRIAQASGAAAVPTESALFDRLSRAEHAVPIELLRKVAERRSGGPGGLGLGRRAGVKACPPPPTRTFPALAVLASNLTCR